MIKYRLLLVFLVFLSLTSAAQDKQPVQFSFEKQNNGNGEFTLAVKAVPSKGVQLFSIQKIPGDLPVNTNFIFDTSIIKYLKDTITEYGSGRTETNPALN